MTDDVVDPRLLRGLRALFAVCVTIGVAGRALAGDPFFASVVGGGVVGGVAFLPLGLLLAGLFWAYSLGRRHSGGPA